ncbi:cytochrome C biogenesis protein ResB [Brachybacterium vulturis]|uniref:Cytochrome C biogenesis protein ResB n=1 Tax=Brachybacterium vulturis TaxID=2017484 RepID=A0A291GM03_9MICO|nr:cytochrome c biogenesis protein ResB [Brachybacterium vulturis]ATG51238.1 cytochrome C biogenesis protein ResB [Brachybacterium vulturis]
MTEKRTSTPADAGEAAESSAWSSKPEIDRKRPPSAPSLGLRGTLLFLWRQLTSMQTALVLLMLLAIAAVPGSLYPQRSVNPALTEQFLEENGRWGEILDALGFFDVFSSPWFSAIYLLLFISLIGCIVPRVGVHLKQLRARPPRTPSRLTRFTGYTRVELAGADGDADALIERARRSLRRSRYRTEVREEAGARSVSAERGLLRESGNLAFHIALVGVLICIAGGQLTSYRGQITVIEGEGFANSLTQYDSFESGAWFDETEMPDFRFTLEDFRATYVQPGEGGSVGEPRSFEADVQVTTPGQEISRTVQVNKPLHVKGASMYLLGNGYAPAITVTDPEGDVVAEGPVITVPMGDVGYTSQVVIKAPDARPEQTAVVGFFLPTGTIDEQGPHSLFPDALDPQLALTVHQGDLGLDSGIPQNAYEVDLTTLTPVVGQDGAPVLIRLYPGQEFELPDGTTVSFDGLRRYAAFDIAHNPFERWILLSALVAVGGLILSLFVPRRRVWVRVRESVDGTVLEVAGLARSDDPALEDDVRALASSLTEAQDGTSDGPHDPHQARPGRAAEHPSEGSAQ